MEFEGSFVALITPFTKENQIDEKALIHFIEWHIQEKSDGIVILGTTGESWAISEKERESIVKVVVEASNGKIPIIVGVGSYDTRKSVRYTEMAKDLGADGCLVVTPYYNRPTQQGCIAHFKEIAKVGLPMILYHHPKRTGCLLDISTLETLSKVKEIVAIKDAYGDLDYMKKIPLPIFSGDDELSLQWYLEGARGTISVVGNIIPGLWSKFSHKCLQRDFKQGEEIFKQSLSLMKLLMLETNPQCVKYALSVMGKCSSQIRLPLLVPRIENQKTIEMFIEKHFLNRTLSDL